MADLKTFFNLTNTAQMSPSKYSAGFRVGQEISNLHYPYMHDGDTLHTDLTKWPVWKMQFLVLWDLSVTKQAIQKLLATWKYVYIIPAGSQVLPLNVCTWMSKASKWTGNAA